MVNLWLLVIGWFRVVIAILFDALANRKLLQDGRGDKNKGITISVISRVLMGFFYRFVAASMTTIFASPDAGLLTSYSAILFLSSEYLFPISFLTRG